MAEKLEALTALGLLNSRIKDYYDLGLLSRMYPFEGERLSQVSLYVKGLRTPGYAIKRSRPRSGESRWTNTRRR